MLGDLSVTACSRLRELDDSLRTGRRDESRPSEERFDSLGGVVGRREHVDLHATTAVESSPNESCLLEHAHENPGVPARNDRRDLLGIYRPGSVPQHAVGRAQV